MHLLTSYACRHPKPCYSTFYGYVACSQLPTQTRAMLPVWPTYPGSSRRCQPIRILITLLADINWRYQPHFNQASLLQYINLLPCLLSHRRSSASLRLSISSHDKIRVMFTSQPTSLLRYNELCLLCSNGGSQYLTVYTNHYCPYLWGSRYRLFLLWT
jgi:hypothetical protein